MESGACSRNYASKLAESRGIWNRVACSHNDASELAESIICV